MCFVLLAWRQQQSLPLLIAANRDEHFKRPTRTLHRWADSPDIIAGRDLEAGGSWFGINAAGRFAIVTNIRIGSSPGTAGSSRGDLIPQFLNSKDSTQSFADDLLRRRHQYRPFNLLFGDSGEIHYLTSQQDSYTILNPGIYGLSNAELDTPWPKVTDGKRELADLVSEPQVAGDDLFSLLGDTRLYDDHLLPDTGVPIELERRLSARFIHGEEYGTRSSSVALFHADGRIRMEERNHRGSFEGRRSVTLEFGL